MYPAPLLIALLIGWHLGGRRVIFVDIEVDVLNLEIPKDMPDGCECNDLEIQAQKGRIKEIQIENIVGRRRHEVNAHRHADK